MEQRLLPEEGRRFLRSSIRLDESGLQPHFPKRHRDAAYMPWRQESRVLAKGPD